MAATARQHEVLSFVQGFIAHHDRSPTFDEIRVHLGLKSKSGVHRVVQALRKDGYLQMREGRHGLELAAPNPETTLLQVTIMRDGGFQVWMSDQAFPAELKALLDPVSNPWTEGVIPPLADRVARMEAAVAADFERPRIPRRVRRPGRNSKAWHAAAFELRDQGYKRKSIAAELGVTLSSVHYLLSDRIRASRARRADALRTSREAGV